MKFLAKLLEHLSRSIQRIGTKKTKVATRGEAQIREVTRLGQHLVVMELS